MCLVPIEYNELLFTNRKEVDVETSFLEKGVLHYH